MRGRKSDTTQLINKKGALTGPTQCLVGTIRPAIPHLYPYMRAYRVVKHVGIVQTLKALLRNKPKSHYLGLFLRTRSLENCVYTGPRLSCTSLLSQARLLSLEIGPMMPYPLEIRNHPIHAELEDYQLGDCPEYETVSYCWGGENGRIDRFHPVYLGDYWDILLQTENCWSMLQYFRLQRNTRLLWVDAICINQEDRLEKEIQVPLMGKIYWSCLRVLVYLGVDIVRPKGTCLVTKRSYPPRHDLTEFEDLIPDDLMKLEDLFKLNYFRRVWVIQELVRAPAAVIPAHGYLFRLRSRPCLNLGSIEAPWISHACSGEFPTKLSPKLQRTSYSQATDLRDRVYGLLGLGSNSEGFRPDYSISYRHTYIGTVLQILVNEEAIEILTEAPGHLSDSNPHHGSPTGIFST